MGKKKKKTAVADKVRSRRYEQVKETNPFEVKINRQKHNVLGRKISKHDTGMPGLSRLKATKKRMEKLLPEFQQQFKSNKLIDKRIGEKDTTLSLEEKMMKRYALERSKGNEKLGKFNLNEEEELTHYGQSLSEIEKFDEPVISDEEEDEEEKKMAAKLVATEHFGGFLTKRAEQEGESKSWKERMEELIVNSKKAKYERQKEKEEGVLMTEKLDEEWKTLQSLTLVTKGSRKHQSEDGPSGPRKDSDFDVIVQELKFETRGQATDRLKSEEELAKEEKQRLEKLEAERKRRMMGITEEESVGITKTYKSADDLDDGFALDEDGPGLVSYRDGRLLGENSGAQGEMEGGSETECPDNEDSDQEDAPGETDEEEESSDSEEESEDGSEDRYSDVESDGEDDVEAVSIADQASKKTSKDLELKTKEGIMAAAKKELPYTFQAPESYDDLLGVLEGHDLEEQLTVIERIIKCHHPSLCEGNKQKLEVLFAHLVQFFGDLCIQDPPQLDFTDRLVPFLYQLASMFPVAAATAVFESLSDRQEEFCQVCERKKGRGLYPDLDTLLILKLASVLFPASDFRHPVTTPAQLFVCQILSQCPVNHERDVAAGLFLCNLGLEYVSLSKRYLPEVINFLHGVLFLAADKEAGRVEAVFPPFRPVGKNISLLQLRDKSGSCKLEKWSMAEVLSSSQEEDSLRRDSFRVCAIRHCLLLLEEFSRLYEELPSYREIFAPVNHMCSKLQQNLYPSTVQDLLERFQSQYIAQADKTRLHLVMRKKKPKPLKMFEPKVEEVFDGRKKKSKGSKEFNEKQKLLHKYKKEMKGAMREIKKDNQFLARYKLQTQMNKDAERKRKVKEIYSSLANQEGDYQKMKRLKAREAHSR